MRETKFSVDAYVLFEIRPLKVCLPGSKNNLGSPHCTAHRLILSFGIV